MGWSYRKSFSSGPFRINFSKSGVSYSAGVKGARINVGPRGTYVNLSAHGISYRHKLSDTPSPVINPALQLVPAVPQAVHNIASASVEALTDTDSKAFVVELTQKAGQISYANWFGVVPMVVFLVIITFTAFTSETVIIQPSTDSTLAKVTSFAGVNVRAAANPRSSILKAATEGEAFTLLDSTNSKWFKVGFQDSVGYINRHFVAITEVHHEQITREQPSWANPYAGYELAGGLIGFILLIKRLKKADKRRFEMELHYAMDEQFQQVYEQFSTTFATFTKSARIWQYLNSHQTHDYKRNAGAGQLIKRIPVIKVITNQNPLPYFTTNVAIPCIKLSHLEFYFLPERLLIKRGAIFAAVFYKNLQINSFITRFIEDESVAHDAQIVDRTWRYVNKHGGPDRRFNNNRQIPICAYSQYTLTSDTGIYEILTTSKQGAMDEFSELLRGIGKLQSQMNLS